MLRALFTAICTVEVVAPERLIRATERLGLENPTEVQLRSWVVPGARVEGLVVLWMLWRSNRSYTQLKRFLAVVGLLAFLYPRAYVTAGSKLAYTGTSEAVWKPWIYPGTRLVGLLYLLVGARELRRQGYRRQ